MLEIIALIFLCKNIGTIAVKKGLKPGQWKLYTVISWIVFEFFGVILGVILFGFNKDELFGLMLFAVACAFGGYLLIKSILDKKPDVFNEDQIDQIGRS